MKLKTIMARQAQENLKYELAKKLREQLDAARKEYGAQAWDDDALEEDICDLVFGSED